MGTSFFALLGAVMLSGLAVNLARLDMPSIVYFFVLIFLVLGYGILANYRPRLAFSLCLTVVVVLPFLI